MLACSIMIIFEKIDFDRKNKKNDKNKNKKKETKRKVEELSVKGINA